MKYRRLLIAGLVFVFIAVIASFSSIARASLIEPAGSDGATRVDSGRTIDGSSLMAGSTITVEGTIDGDLLCAGESLEVTGTINGDIVCAVGTASIKGTVKGDVRIVASETNIEGKVDGNASVAASTFRVSDSGSIGGDLSAAASRVAVAGSVGRDAALFASEVDISGEIQRDVSLTASQFRLEQGASIEGNLWYSAEERIASESAVAGTTTYEPRQQRQPQSDVAGAILGGALAFIVFAILYVMVAPRFVHTAASLNVRQAMMSFVIGITVLISLPAVAVPFLLSGIGAIVGIFIILAWLCAFIGSGVFASYYIGSLVAQNRFPNAIAIVAIGATILSVLMIVPFINALVIIVAVASGVGMQIMHIRHQFSKSPYTIES